MGQSSCKTCTEGYYCDGYNPLNPDSISIRKDCPVGHYCPPGTASPFAFPCPVPTFSNETRLVSVSQCRRCLPGMYCDTPGQIEPAGPCDPGYYCVSNSSTATPTDGISGDICPEGFYCLEGSTFPTPCPAGFYSNTTGNTVEADCGPCPAGLWCDSQGNQFECDVCPLSSQQLLQLLLYIYVYTYFSLSLFHLSPLFPQSRDAPVGCACLVLCLYLCVSLPVCLCAHFIACG